MMRLRLATALCILGFFSAALAEQQQDQTVEYLQNWVAQVKGEIPTAPTSPELPPIKCGTPAFIALSTYNHLHLGTVLPAQNERPSNLPDTFGTAHFIIHYTITGPDSVYRPGLDSIPGIPSHVTRTADVFEHVWSIEIDSLGYQTPPTDFGNGGDNRYDIYLANLGFGYYGFTVPESTMLRNGVYIASSFIELENDFAESPTYHNHPLDAVKVTAAHEFFHSIQLSYDEFEEEIGDPHDRNTYKPWWPEASSTWMEGVVYNSIKDYISYLPYFYGYIWAGLGIFGGPGSSPLEQFHPYASCVWPIYMTKRFSDLDLMRRIWQICGQVNGYNTLPATNSVLNNYGSDLSSAFLEFEKWNFQTGALADTVNTYTDGRHYPAAETTAYVSDLTIIPSFSIPNSIQFPQQFATNYIIVNSPGVPGGVITNFDGLNLPGGQGWHVGLMGFRVGDSHLDEINVNPSSGVGGGDWPGWDNYQCVVLIPTVTGLTPNGSAFFYNADLYYDPSDTGGGGNQILSIVKAYPSPFMISDDTSLIIQYSLDKFYAFSEMNIFIYDASGALVEELSGDVTWRNFPGIHNVQWDGKSAGGDYVASGIYIILFKAGSNTATGKIAVVNNTR
jgi:hypothetical protein